MEVDQVAESLSASIIIYAAHGFQLMANDRQFERLGGLNLTPVCNSSPGLRLPGVPMATSVFTAVEYPDTRLWICRAHKESRVKPPGWPSMDGPAEIPLRKFRHAPATLPDLA